MDILHSALSLFTKIPLTVFDYLFILALFIYLYEEFTLGAKAAASHTIAIIASFFAGLFTYAYLSALITTAFSLSKGISDALSFFVIALLTYILVSKIVFTLTTKLVGIFPRYTSSFLALLFGSISFLLISSFVIALFLSFPVAVSIKHAIKQSVVGPFFITKTQNIEVAVKQIFGATIDETLNFLTVKPNSEGSVALHFATTNISIDTSSEKRMLELVNIARKQKNLLPLKANSELTHAARLHGQDMFKRGYFSHYTPEGFTPFDRLENQGISYTAAAENLAYAPDVELAFSGLMKSQGHKKNILDDAFQKIGIGVIDGGIYGKMFVQEFSD